MTTPADRFDLIQRLCVVAGTIMEDASIEAVSRLSSDPDERARRLERLECAGNDIAALLSAATALNRRFED